MALPVGGLSPAWLEVCVGSTAAALALVRQCILEFTGAIASRRDVVGGLAGGVPPLPRS